MRYTTRTGTLADLDTPCLVTTRAQARKVAANRGQEALFDAAMADFSDKPGQVQLVNLTRGSKVKRLMVAGGADDEVTPADYRKIVNAAARALKPLKESTALWALGSTRVAARDVYWRYSAGLWALSSALYTFTEHKTGDDAKPLALRTVQVHADARSRSWVQRAVREGNALQSGLDFARDLGGQPPNICNPTYLLREARKLSRLDKVRVSALDERRMKDMGMGAFMAVSQGSHTPGRMIIVEYRGGKTGDAPVVLVGKGITFDTGGISLKPAADDGRDEVRHVRRRQPCSAPPGPPPRRSCRSTWWVWCRGENMPGGGAVKPGDMVAPCPAKPSRSSTPTPRDA